MGSVLGGCWCFGCGVVRGLLWLSRRGGLTVDIGGEIEYGSSVQGCLGQLWGFWVDIVEGWLTMR